jgi:transcriptional regulator with XRE-family HTH domain
LAFGQGARDGYVVHVPVTIDVKAIREKVRMSQDEFARQYGFSKRSLEQWEQGRRTLPARHALFLWSSPVNRMPCTAPLRALRVNGLAAKIFMSQGGFPISH